MNQRREVRRDLDTDVWTFVRRIAEDEDEACGCARLGWFGLGHHGDCAVAAARDLLIRLDGRKRAWLEGV